MKSEKGITLISLTVYVIVMTLVIAVIATITTFFYQNIKDVNVDIDPITEYTTFNRYFSEEINRGNLDILECKTEEDEKLSYVVFSNGVQYTYVAENKGIYRNKVKICRNIEKCIFSESIENGKDVIKVQFQAGKQDRTTTYTLKN